MTKTKIHPELHSATRLGSMPTGLVSQRQSKSELIAALLAESLKLHQSGRLVEAKIRRGIRRFDNSAKMRRTTSLVVARVVAELKGAWSNAKGA